MRMFTPAWVRNTAMLLAFVMGLCAIAPPVQGAIVSSQMVTLADVRAADMGKVQQLMEQKIVQSRLQDLGFTQEEIQQRILRASDAELHQLAQQYDALMAGGDDLSILGILLVVLLVVLIIKLID